MKASASFILYIYRNFKMMRNNNCPYQKYSTFYDLLKISMQNCLKKF